MALVTYGCGHEWIRATGEPEPPGGRVIHDPALCPECQVSKAVR